MKGVYKTESVRRAEKAAIAEVGEDELIERAAACLYARLKASEYRYVAVFAGGGNNGSDALSLARLLINGGIKCKIFLCSEKRNDFVRARIADLVASGANVTELKSDINIDGCDVIVDGMLGIGCSRPLTGVMAEAARKINDSGAYVLAVDIPSGLDSDTGMPYGECVAADETATFIAVKQGLLIGKARSYCGKIKLYDIGVHAGTPDFYVAEESDLRMPPRKTVSNKGNYGNVKIIAGSPTMIGASLLAHESASAALRGGAGYAVLCVPRSLAAVYQARVKEEMLYFMPDEGGVTTFDESALDEIMRKACSIVIGMGMGKNPDLPKIINYIARSFDGTLVVDGDGLNALASDLSVVKDHKCRLVLTPHVVEFARLYGGMSDSLPDTEKTAELAERLNAVIAMKSATTVISDGKKTFINLTGTPAMAKAGSGDVLGGLIGALVAKDDPLIGVVRACHFFGKAGEAAEKERGETSVLASDVIIKFADVLPDREAVEF